jgi:triosephosphate isomerase
MRPTIIAGNWKLHCTLAEAEALVRGMLPAAVQAAERQVLLCPPFTALDRVRQVVAGGGAANLRLGGQDLYWEERGAFTGEISASLLSDCGCSHVLVGHSERRHVFGEKDDESGHKVAAALRAGLTPVLCVGEKIGERRAGETTEVVERQLAAGLGTWRPGENGGVVIAYEPVWAIGTGETATTEQAQETHATIRSWLVGRFGGAVAEETPILYGGSVKDTNAAELLTGPDIDGVLVGGASLDAAVFSRIITAGL